MADSQLLPGEDSDALRWPAFAADEVAAAVRVLRSGRVNYWTGQECRLFEREFAAAVNAKYAVAMANGTVALEAAAHALGLNCGDEVITTPRSFIASASTIALRGIKPIFADVDEDSGNITAETCARVLTPKTKAILCVHLAGWPCEMDEILALARSRGLYVIEDCAQAHGSLYRGQAMGTFGDVGAWSFCQDKMITTAGEGGMLTTNAAAIWRKCWSLKDHGKNPDLALNTVAGTQFRWVHDSLGSNYRLTEIQAAVGRCQLQKLASRVAQTRRNAETLITRLGSIPALRVPVPPPHVAHAYYKFYTYLRPEALVSSWSRDRITAELAAEGVTCMVGSCPEIYREQAFVTRGLAPDKPLPVAQRLGETSMMFLVHPNLTQDNMQSVADAVERVMARATR